MGSHRVGHDWSDLAAAAVAAAAEIFHSTYLSRFLLHTGSMAQWLKLNHAVRAWVDIPALGLWAVWATLNSRLSEFGISSIKWKQAENFIKWPTDRSASRSANKMLATTILKLGASHCISGVHALCVLLFCFSLTLVKYNLQTTSHTSV